MLGILILFQRYTILNSAKNVLMPLEPKILLTCERIGEALEIVYDVLYTFCTNRIGTKEYAEHHGMELEPSSSNWYSKKIPRRAIHFLAPLLLG